MSYILKKWALVEHPSSPYAAPELRTRGLAGEVYGHPGFPDGSQIITSTAVRAEGRRVFTKSGSEYLLEGPPDDGFVKFLEESKLPPLDPEDPFKKVA